MSQEQFQGFIRNLGVRARNVVVRMGLRLPEDLASKSAEDFARQRYCGQVTTREIIKVALAHKLEIHPSLSAVRAGIVSSHPSVGAAIQALGMAKHAIGDARKAFLKSQREDELRLRDSEQHRLTRSQLEFVLYLLENAHNSKVAKDLGISASAVSERSRRLHRKIAILLRQCPVEGQGATSLQKEAT